MRFRHKWILSILLAVVGSLLFGVPASAEPAQQGGVHVVAAGETLSSIALRYGITADSLSRANNLANPNFVFAGQRLTIPGAGTASGAAVSTGDIHVVSGGESLHTIAQRYGTSIQALADANALSNPNFVYVGQRLRIPAGGAHRAAALPASSGQVHVVQPGQSLSSIATRYGVSLSALASANGLVNPDFVYAGQRLTIPAGGGGGSAAAAPAPAAASSGRWIGINLTTQTLTAYEGNLAVFSTIVSTGTWRTPTVTGRFTIQSKYPAVDMSGPGYYLPGVPWTMFFYRGYAIHGTYWHTNFGTPMSHGCVNLTTPDAQWVYNFASIGTPVVVHY